MRSRRILGGVAAACAAAAAWGCGPGGGAPGEGAANPGAAPAAPTASSPAEADAVRRIEADLSGLIDEVSKRYHPMVYRYDEIMLEKVDKISAWLVSGDAPAGPEPEREIAEIPAEEERAHFAETIRRWEAKSGADFRREVDRLKAELAGVDPKESFHPEFHKSFAKVFDDFVAIEVAEMRERRNRALHAGAAPILDAARGEHPEAVRRVEADLLGKPPYDLPQAAH